MPAIQRAILSCYDKTGIVDFARFLQGEGVELISTSGTLKELQDNGVEATSIADFTGVPELMDGRVKSLHSKVHAGLLGLRDNKLHVEQLQEHEMEWIDMLVVNLQPVEDLVGRTGVQLDEVMEQTDIGGAAMIRSAAKNFRYVTVIVNPDHYGKVMHEMRAYENEVSFTTRYRLAKEAFFATAAYDQGIAEYLQKNEPPKK